MASLQEAIKSGRRFRMELEDGTFGYWMYVNKARGQIFYDTTFHPLVDFDVKMLTASYEIEQKKVEVTGDDIKAAFKRAWEKEPMYGWDLQGLVLKELGLEDV